MESRKRIKRKSQLQSQSMERTLSSQCFSDQRDQPDTFGQKIKAIAGKEPGQKRMRAAATDRNDALNADFNRQIEKGNFN